MQKITEASDEKLEMIIVDLRGERHCAINGLPAVWKNEEIKPGETVEEIMKDEEARIAEIGETVLIKERKGKVRSMKVQRASNEQKLVEEFGFRYARFPMIEHLRPTDQCVDDLVKFILMNPNAWIHMHCYVSARTTIALVIADMLHNPELLFEEILYRGFAIGGSDLMKKPDETSAKYPLFYRAPRFFIRFSSILSKRESI